MSDRRIPLRLPHLQAFALRALLLAAVWWALTEGSGGWIFGAVLAVTVAALSLTHTPPAAAMLRLHRVPGFIFYFLLQSLVAGWDVARRILRPRLPLRPQLMRIPLRLPPGAPTWWLMLVLSLLPGTLSVGLSDGELELHCLDCEGDVLAEAREAEAQLARLFGHALGESGEAEAGAGR